MAINPEKIRIMVDLAKQEQKVGKKNYIINSYFKSDYVGRYMLGSFLSYTVCYFLFIIAWTMYKFDVIGNEPDILKIVYMYRPHIGYYLAGLIVYELIVIIVYAIRYTKGKREIRVNTAKLKRLQRLF